MLIVIDERPRGRWQTNLTDHECVIRKREHRTAAEALAEVGRLTRQGHRVAFRSALRDLVRAVPPAPLPELLAIVAD